MLATPHMFFDVHDQAWMSEAACRNVADPDIFFPMYGKGYLEAKALCDACPVIEQCRRYGLFLGDGAQFDFGIWGGLDPEERAIRRKARIRSSQ